MKKMSQDEMRNVNGGISKTVRLGNRYCYQLVTKSGKVKTVKRPVPNIPAVRYRWR